MLRHRLVVSILVLSLLLTCFKLSYGENKTEKQKRLNQELLEAVKNDQISLVESLIRDGADVNAKDEDEVTTLMWAVTNSQADIVQALLDNGADLDAQDKNGWTTFIRVSRSGEPEKVRLILAGGGSVNICKSFINPLKAAINGQKIENVRILIEAGADVNARCALVGGSTPLMDAALLGNVEITTLLLQAGVKLNLKNGAGKTALDLAKSSEHMEVVRVLQAAGAKE